MQLLKSRMGIIIISLFLRNVQAASKIWNILVKQNNVFIIFHLLIAILEIKFS